VQLYSHFKCDAVEQVVVQCAVRMFQCRRCLLDRLHHKCAVAIQRVWRGHSSRNDLFSSLTDAPLPLAADGSDCGMEAVQGGAAVDDASPSPTAAPASPRAASCNDHHVSSSCRETPVLPDAVASAAAVVHEVLLYTERGAAQEARPAPRCAPSCAATARASHASAFLINFVHHSAHFTGNTGSDSDADAPVVAPAAALLDHSDTPALRPPAVPRLNVAAVTLAPHEDDPHLFARREAGEDVAADTGELRGGEQEQEQEQEQGEADSDRYSDEDHPSDASSTAPPPAFLRALDAFSQLFAQIDYPLADGFSYISGDAPSFTLQQLVEFCRQYMQHALSEEEVRAVFQHMDADGDGSVFASDWVSFFNRLVAARDVSAAVLAADNDAPNSSVRACALAAAAASAGVELQESENISEELMDTLQQLQQELVRGAAHALHLHNASSQHQSSDAASCAVESP
jgi:hypothetical protein